MKGAHGSLARGQGVYGKYSSWVREIIEIEIINSHRNRDKLKNQTLKICNKY